MSRVLLVSFLVCAGCLVGCHRYLSSGPRPIEAKPDDAPVPDFVGAPSAAAPLPPQVLPQHPFMAPNGRSCMHVDAQGSNTYGWPGPRGRSPQVGSNSLGFFGGECPMAAFDAQGRIVTVCVNMRKPRLLLLDPVSLRVLARYTLPKRQVPIFRIREAVNDTSGGAYFFLDEQGRAVVGTADGNIDIVAIEEGPKGPRFDPVRLLDLEPALELGDGTADRITAVMPDWSGRLWFVGRYGTVGTVTRDGEVMRSIYLDGEEIENSFSVGPEGVYIVSDHAMYRFEAAEDGTPEVVWRESYDRGTRTKVGQINQGSGTTPTLLGDDYVAIADNADPQLHVLVLRRGREVEGNRLVCSVPLFAPGKSATENTFIGYDHSLIVENNAGYDLFRTMRGGRISAPGVARVDVRPDGSGCDVAWVADVSSQTTVPKLSTETGLVYLYTKLPNAPHGIDAYYLTALDFRTGRIAYQVLTGTGVRFDNNWAAVSLGPDGAAYVGVLNGVLRIEDRGP